MSPSILTLPLTAAALGPALSAWRDQHPQGGVLALLPEAEAAGLPLLQALCAARDLPLVGAIFPALLGPSGFSSQGVCLLRFAVMPAYALLDGFGPDASAAAGRIAAFVNGAVDPAESPTLFLLGDAMVPNVTSILDALYLELADGVHYAGVNAGSETFAPMPCLFDGQRLTQGGALCLILGQHRPPSLEHGFDTPARSLTATSTEGNRILRIDWRPAFEVYQELVAQDHGIALTAENFYTYGVHYPFGILRAAGDLTVRIPVALAEDGALICVGEVPPNSVLVLLKADEVDTSRCVPDLARALTAARPVENLLAFYCAGRRMHMGASADREVAQLFAAVGPKTMAGALSLGEIGSRQAWGYPLFHNAALVALDWDPA